MTAERQQLGTAIGLSTTANALLVLALVWAMAVTDGLTAGKRRDLTALPTPTATPPETINLVLSASPEPQINTPRKPYVRSTGDPAETAPDKDTTFISSQNMRAATERDARLDGISGMPTQDGLDKPYLDFRDTDFRQGIGSGDLPQEAPVDTKESLSQSPTDSPPSPATPQRPPDALAATPTQDRPAEPASAALSPDQSPATSSAPDTAPAPVAFQDPNSENRLPLAPLKNRQDPKNPGATPPPPPQPRTTFRSGRIKSKTRGTLSSKADKSSLDAVASEEGRFNKILSTAIEKTWRRRMLSLAGLANPGLVEVEFEIDVKGRISNVRLANPGEANPVMQDVALSAIIDAKLPPPPAELFENLNDAITGNRMRCNFTFLIY